MPPGQPGSFEYRAMQNERDQLRLALDDESSRAAALQQRAADATRQWETARADASTLSARLDRLTESYDRLQKLVEERAGQAPDRPRVPTAALDENVDGALSDLAQRHAAQLWYDAARGAISFANDRMFEPGSDAVLPAARPGIDDLAGVLAKTDSDEYEIVIVGHTDDSPISKPETLARHPSNWHLAVHRAIAVKDALVAAGVPSQRIGVMGYGDQRPIGGDKSRNRRVEVFLVRSGDVRALPAIRPR